MEYTINVPRLDWLIGGSRIGGTYNTYYGSCGTDGETGFFGRKLFNYVIRLEKLEDETEVMKASVYSGYKSFENTDPDGVETEVFELEEDSRALIKAWIEEKCRQYFSE
ncbi:MAG: hypothetical protein MR567_05295 [Oscillospiraceae bacterium]|nr:hypothetical protein [Oscillospiraceae bacterium]